MLFERVAERQSSLDPVVVAPARASPFQVPVGLQVGENALDGPFRYADLLRDVTNPRFGVGGDADQHVRVVGEEGPAPGESVTHSLLA